ncbi:MAG: hypothetical protein AAGE01_05340 [Pseudomonadota bacterium]
MRLLLALLLTAMPALVAFGATLELRDGSIVKGRILSLSDGVYRVRTDSLGIVTIEESQVYSVLRGDAQGASPRSPATPAPRTAPTTVPGASAATGVDVSALQKSMVQSPQVMALVRELQNDPELVAAMSDPEFMRLIAAGDLAALRANPRMQTILNNPSIRRIIEQMGVNP